MKKANKLLALLLAVVMVLALAACGTQTTAPAAQSGDATKADAPAAAGEIVINFPCIWVGTDTKANYMAKLIEDFNAENAGSIKVVVEEQTDYDAYRDKVRTLITTGTVPDICILDGTFDYKAYTESGKFVDLTPYLEAGWGENFAEGAIETWSIDGKISIVPFEAAVFPLIYNTTIMKAVGWEKTPETYDEFFQFCKDCKDAGYNAVGQMAGANAWSSMLWYSLLVEAIGGEDVYADGLKNPAFVQAAEMLKELYGYTFDGAVSATAGDVNKHWIDRDTAVYLNGPWWIGNLYKEDNAKDGVLLADECVVAYPPVLEGGKGDAKGVVTCVQAFLAVAKQDDPAKEAALIKFLQYITDPARVAEWSLDSGAMFFINYELSDNANDIAKAFYHIYNDRSYAILHVNSALPTAFSTELPAAVSALALDQREASVAAQAFVDQLQTAIDNAA